MVLTLFISWMSILGLFDQEEYPVTWRISADRNVEKEYQVTFEAYIDEGWVIYGMNTPTGGPIGTSFSFDPADHFELQGQIAEITLPEKKFEPLFDIEVLKFSKKAVFVQHVSNTGSSKVVNGNIRYMACDGTKCLPPTDVPFIALLK